MTSYALADSGQIVDWQAPEPPTMFHQVERWTAMSGAELQPATLYFSDLGQARKACWKWIEQEPWRCHARITTFAPHHYAGWEWWARNLQTNAIEIDDFRPIEPK